MATFGLMDDTEFAEFRKRIGRMIHAKDRKRLVKSAAKNHKFTVAQVRKLLPKADEPKEKFLYLKFCKGCIDPAEDIAPIVDYFDYDEYKEKAQKILRPDGAAAAAAPPAESAPTDSAPADSSS